MKSPDTPSPLTMKILECKERGGDIASLVEEIALLVYAYPVNKLRWTQDDGSDFFCWFFPRIPALIERFKFIGKDFEAYLYVTLKWQCQTFAEKKRNRQRDYTIVNRMELWPNYWMEDPCVSENTPLLLTESARKIFRMKGEKISDETAKRRLMYITLKGADYITCHIVETVATLTGIDAEWIFMCIEKLKRGMAAKKERMAYLRQKRNRAFMRIYCIHEDMFLEYDPSAKEKLLCQLKKEKNRLASILDEMSRVPSSPTHKDIAAVLGIPKGSVDSGIYYLKNALEKHCA